MGYGRKITTVIYRWQYHKSGIIYNRSKEAFLCDNVKLNSLYKFDFGLIFVNFQKKIPNEHRFVLFSIPFARSFF